MPRRLFWLAFCAVAAVAADVCRDLPEMDPHGFRDTEAARRGVLEPATGGGSYLRDATSSAESFRLVVKAGGPAFRITITAGSIEVARCDDGKRLQVIEVVSEQVIDFARTYHTFDVNFDGYLDFAVLVCSEVSSEASRGGFLIQRMGPSFRTSSRRRFAH